MRILMISPQFHPLVGGYERAAERLSVALAERGHETTVFTERRVRAWPRSETLRGIFVRRWWCIYRPGVHTASSLLSLAGLLLLRGRGFDVWHVHQYGAGAALAIALGRLLRRPVVLKLTSSAGQGIERSVGAGRFSGAARRLHRGATAVVAPSRETAAEAASFGFAEPRIHILGNGVDTVLFRPRAEEERVRLKRQLGLGEQLVVIFVGRLSAEKNVAGLLQAWSLVQETAAVPSRLVLVGDGPLRQELQALAAGLRISEAVLFAGQRSDVAEWLAASDVFVLPSHNEGLSNTLLEAMASGLPAVVTRVSGSKELVEETDSGAVVPVGDMDRFAEALARLACSAPARAAQGANARRFIERCYSIGHIAERHEALYASLIGQPRLAAGNR